MELVINEKRHPECLAMLGLTLLEVQEDYIRISSNPHDTNGFDVSYFDMPLVDNIRLGELTYSVILSSTDKESGKAKVQIVILPEHYYSARNSLRFDEYIGCFLHEDFSQ